MPKRRILIVDDHPLMRRGMAQLISQQPDLSVCGEAGDARAGLAAVGTSHPDLVLADITLPDKPGLEFIKDIKALYTDTPVLVVSMHDENLFAERALRAGSRGYIMKNDGGEGLVAAIRQVLAGRVYLSHDLSERLLDVLSGTRWPASDNATAALTDREFEVFQFIGQGLTTREIGQRMHLSPKTIETHRLHIRNKLGIKTWPELVKQAVRWAGAQELV